MSTVPGPEFQRQALVLGLVDYGDRHRIVRLLTPEEGRISALARHARGSRRRFGGALDVGNRVEVSIRQGRGELGILGGAVVRGDRSRIREDLVRMALMLYACEFVGAFCREGRAEPRMFGLLETALVLLDGWVPPAAAPGTTAPDPLYRHGIESKALTFAGLRPRLITCARCGGPIEGEANFEMGAGGAVHAGCGPGEPVDGAFLGRLEHALRTPLKDLLDGPPPGGPPWLLARFGEFHLGRPIRSRHWLSTVLSP